MFNQQHPKTNIKIFALFFTIFFCNYTFAEEIFGKWNLYAKSSALDSVKSQEDIDWFFKNDGLLTISNITFKYFIGQDNIEKQFQPGREKYETCNIIKLEEDEMILHCKFEFFFFSRVERLSESTNSFLSTIDNDNVEAILNVSELFFPQFFPLNQLTQQIDSIFLRFYPSTGIYLGVNFLEEGLVKEGVYLLGGVFGDRPLFVGTLDEIKAVLVNMILDEILKNIQNAQNSIDSNSEAVAILTSINTAIDLTRELSSGFTFDNFSFDEDVLTINSSLKKARKEARSTVNVEKIKKLLTSAANFSIALKAQL